MFASALLIAASLLPAAPEANSSGALTVMTWNVRYGTANDGPDAWDLRKDLLVKRIAEHAPAVLGTQECLDFQAQYIVDHLAGYAWLGLGREEDGNGEMTAIIYQKSLLLPLETGHLWLSETPDRPGSKSWDSSLPRIASWVKFFNRATQQPFYFYNTHFDHRGEVARLESARLIEARIRNVHANDVVVLTGDFNCVGGASEPWKTLTAGGLQDLWDAAAERKGTANTWNGFEVPVSDADRRIDWILTTPGVRVPFCEIDAYQEGGRFPSDHLPVIARILLPVAR